MGDGRWRERQREAIVALRYMKTDAEAIPGHIEAIQFNLNKLDYDYDDPDELSGLREIREELHTVEQRLLEMMMRVIR